MKKMLVNAYLALNLGDDLFLKILVETFKDINWVIPTSDLKYQEIFGRYKNVIIPNVFYSKVKGYLNIPYKNNIFTSYDGVVYIGGSIFIQNEIWKKDFLNRKKVITSFVNKKLPIFILGSNFGPFIDNEFKKEYSLLFSQCTDISFRETLSYNLFSHLKNIRHNPDIIFQLIPKNIPKKSNSIGISIINLSNREELKGYKEIYESKMIELIKKSCEKNKRITLFSFCEREGDLQAINNILKKLDFKISSQVDICNYTGDIDYFLEIFESMECIVGARFHACILSQVFQQNLYPIIYSQKTLNVLQDIGLDKYYTKIKEIESLNVEDLLNNMIGNRIKNNEIFDQSKKHFEVLNNYLRGGIDFEL